MPRSAAMSSDGKCSVYCYCSGWTAGISVSSNYCVTKTEKLSVQSGIYYPSPIVAMSDSGQYATMIMRTYNSNDCLYVSSNYGETWVAKEAFNNPATYYTNPSVSADGQYQVCLVGSNIIGSDDFGATWTIRFAPTGMSTIYASASAISGDGKIQVINAGGKLWFSSDYGKTWSARMSLKETRYKGEQRSLQRSLAYASIIKRRM